MGDFFEMSAAIVAVFGPAPDGIDLSANNTPRDNAVSIAMVAAAVVTVALRVVTKLTILSSKLSSDDYLMIASLVSWYFGLCLSE